MCNIVNVKFSDVVWPASFAGPNTFDKDIRTEFLKDRNGILFGYNDLVDILKAYVQDEYGECPTSLDFSISLIGN